MRDPSCFPSEASLAPSSSLIPSPSSSHTAVPTPSPLRSAPMAGLNDMSGLASKIATLCNPPQITIDPASLQPADASTLERSLVLKVISDVEAKPRGLRESLMAAWHPRDPVTFREEGWNFFLVLFSLKEDADRIFRSGPWTYNRDMITLRRSKPLASAASYDFSSFDICVQISGLPFKLVTEPNLRKVTESFGIFKAYGGEDIGPGGSFVRVKLSLPVDQPLLPAIMLPLPSKPHHQLQLRYEKLGRYCSFCGRIGHDDRPCSLIEELDAKLEARDLPP